MAKESTEINMKQQAINRWFIAIVILLILGLFSLFAAGIVGAFISVDDVMESGNIALIKVYGPITLDSPDRLIGGNMAEASEIIHLIEKADANSEVVAILLDINSPGGGAVASYEIADAVKKTNKTVVAVIREVGASGGYWVASAAEYVIANPMSITGSIGVIGSYLDFSKFIMDHNVSYQRLVSGEYKDMGIPFRELTSEEESILQDNLDAIKAEFVSGVAVNRGMEYSEVDAIATGLFYLGNEAFELGLVDKLGGMDDAIVYIEDKHDIEAEVAEYKKVKTWSDVLMELFASRSFNIGLGLGQGIKIET